MSWFRTVVSWLRGSAAAVPLTSYRPTLEPLEERWVPSPIPRPAHVVLVVEENHAFSQIIGSPDAPYINALAASPNAALFTQSFSLTHPSQPNYLFLFSGSTQGVTDDSTPPITFRTPNLGAALRAHGLSFVGFAESLPFAGFTGDTSGAYARKHAPWVNREGAGHNRLPARVNQPFAAFPANFNRLPTASFVTPNLQDDMHDGTVAAGDAWLQQNLGAYVQWAQTHHSLLILTFDEDDQLNNNQITTLFVGAGVRHGQFSEMITHLSVLRTIEGMYGLPRVGGSAAVPPITDVWLRRR
jgi:acid phosphatase